MCVRLLSEAVHSGRIYMSSNFKYKNWQEYILHEISHSVLLGCGLHIPEYIESWVSVRVEAMPLLKADWHEVRTCAVEMRAAILLGIDIGQPSDILADTLEVLSYKKAISQINSLIWTEKSYFYAIKIIESIRALSSVG